MVKSAVRVVEVLEFVSATPSGASHSEIAAGLGIPKSSLSGLLQDLRETGYLDFSPRSRVYIMGPQVLHLATAFNRQFDLVQVGASAVAEVVEKVNESCKLAILDGQNILVVYNKSASQQLVSTMQMGDRAPWHVTAAGKAMIAFLSLEERQRAVDAIRWERFTEKSNCDPEKLVAELDAIVQGAAATSVEEYIRGQVTMAYPIRESSGHAIAAMSVAAPAIRWDPSLAERCNAALAQATSKLAMRLGFR